MSARIVTVMLAVGLTFSLVLLAGQARALRLPGNNQGYEPVQPIAYAHRLHAGELGINCLYCHGGAERSRHAGIPAASTCMNCHLRVTAPLASVRAEDDQAKKEGRAARPVIAPELGKLYDALALSPIGPGGALVPDPTKTPRPIVWQRVNRLPDFVYFDHRAHVGAGVTCQTCHGPIETMERVRQVPNLSMGWCVQCHRTTAKTGVAGKPVQPSTDSSTCHY